MKTRMNRRRVLAGAAAGAASLVILRHSPSAWSYQANERLSVAVVGVGKRGTYHVGAVGRIGQDLVAVCDANQKHVADVLKNRPKVRKYQDFRKMLDEMDRQLDAVIVATPDHTHAVIAATAMKRGKHVYVEKPMGHDVAECRALRRIAREKKVATQMGNQGMATDSFRRTLELIEDGAVGEIREAHAWFVFGGSGPIKRPKDTPPVPENLNWDLWLGPAPMRPYHPSYAGGWGAWRDYSTGCLGGGGSHSINLTFKALKLGALWQGVEGQARIRVETEIPEPCPESLPRWQIVRFDIPARGPLPPARIHWYNVGGEQKVPESGLKRIGIWQKLEKIAGRPLKWQDDSWTPESGTLLVGSKGVVHTNAHNSVCALLPEKDFPNTSGPPRRLPHVRGHEPEWIGACKGGPPGLSNFEHSGPAIELLLLGNVASLFHQPLEFDPAAMKIVNSAEADALLRPTHREGWAV